MSVKYDKLDRILMARGKKRSDLREILPTATVARLKKNEYISMESMEKICIFLDCQPSDFIEVYKTVTYIDENGEEQKTEVPTDNEPRIKFQELLDNPMLKTVMGMFKSAAQTEEEKKAVEGAENFFDVLKPKRQE